MDKAMSKWEALGILMVLAFLNYLDRHLLFPLATPIAREFGLSNEQVGALTSGFQVVYACAAPLIGYFADRFPRKSILLVALVSWSLVTAGSGLSVGFLSLLAMRSLTGLGEGGYFPTAVSLIGDLFPSNQRGLAISLHGVCTALGGSAGLFVAGALGERYGWRSAFFLAVFPGLLLAAVLALRFREPARGAGPEPGAPARPQARRRYLAIVLSPAVLVIAFAAAAANFATGSLIAFMPKYLVEARALSLGDAGRFTGYCFAAFIPGSLLGGLLSDRLALRVRGVRPLLVGLAYLVAFPAVLAVTQLPVLAAALVCYGLAHAARGFAEPNIYGTILDAVPSHERGTAQGFLLAATFVGGSSGTWLTGRMIDAAGGFGPAFALLAVLCAVSGGLALSLAVWLRVRPATPTAVV